MYNLIVSYGDQWLSTATLELPRERFLEYTRTAYREQLVSLSTEAIHCMESWPCLLMQEGRGQERAHLGRVDQIRATRADLVLSLGLLDVAPALLNDSLWRNRERLGIEQFEFTRTHWAIKPYDLLEVLEDEGYRFADAAFAALPLPAPNRSRLLEARTVIGEWGHTEIDDLLLEAGVAGLAASRDVGSRRDRANEILRFALDNPGATTAENHLFSAFLVRAAYSQEEEPKGHEPDGSAPVSVLPHQSSLRRGAGDEPPSPNRVFVVHGRDEESRGRVVDYLREVGLDAVVLHEQPNMGRHLLTKFIEEAELATFAVILMTADDLGGQSASELAPRARQNVILELGYFLAHLGQPRVCALVTPGLETPSDFDGIVYIRMDDSGDWQRQLRRELVAANMPVNDRGPAA